MPTLPQFHRPTFPTNTLSTMRASVLFAALLLPLAAHAGFDWGAVTSTSSKQQGDVSDGGWERDGPLGGA